MLFNIPKWAHTHTHRRTDPTACRSISRSGLKVKILCTRPMPDGQKDWKGKTEGESLAACSSVTLRDTFHSFFYQKWICAVRDNTMFNPVPSCRLLTALLHHSHARCSSDISAPTAVQRAGAHRKWKSDPEASGQIRALCWRLWLRGE